MIFIILALSLVLFTISIFSAIKKETSYFPAYVTLLLILTYVIAPLSNLYLGLGTHEYYSSYFVFESESLVYASVIVLVFSFAYFLASKFSAANNNIYVKTSPQLDGARFIFGLFLFALICFFSFAYLYGGIEYVYANASKIRSGVDENKNYLAAFLKLFTYYIELIVFFFLAKIYLVKRSKRLSYALIFLGFFLIAVVKSFADGGRGGFINLILGMVFIVIAHDRWRLPKVKVIFGLGIAIFIGVYGKIYLFQLFNDRSLSFSEIEALSISDQIIREYSHQFSSLVLAVDKELAFERFYSDYFIWFVKPLKLLGMTIPDSISYFNTYQATGIWDSEIPPGVVAMNYFQGGLIGVALSGFIIGFLVKWIDRAIVNTIKFNNSIFSYALCAVVYIYIPFAFVNADPALFVQWILAYVLLFVYLFIRNRLRLVRIQRIQ